MQTFYTFRPLLKRTLWGGDDIIKLKQTTDSHHYIGESWEVSGVPGDETVVACGEDEGLSLQQLTRRYGADFVGSYILRRYGETFPLLVKFISAGQALSVQVHPDDTLARRLGHPNGKTEMWYIISARPGAKIISGFNRPFSAREYSERLRDDTIMDVVRQHESLAGQCYFIPAGRIHSIGAGNFLIEIQQTSDDTFRVYDFGRVNDLGQRRELHVEQAKEALNFVDCASSPIPYPASKGSPTMLVNCREFTARQTAATQPLTLDYSRIDSFAIIICYEGRMRLTSGGESLQLQAGQSVLLPATTAQLHVQPDGDGVKFLDTYIEQ